LYSATHLQNPGFCIAAFSAWAYGIPLNVLGTKRQQNFDKFGPLDKLWALQEFVELLPRRPNIIIAFIDAYGAYMVVMA
jgi:hypothetical protein